MTTVIQSAAERVEPVYAISLPRKVKLGRELWWEVLQSNGRVMLCETKQSAEQFYRENRRPQ